MSIEVAVFQHTRNNVPSINNVGVVNTNGTAVTWVSGDKFNTAWKDGQLITINGVNRLVLSVTNAESLTLRTTAGVQTGVGYGVYRVYTLTAHQDAIDPYIVLNKVSGVREYTHTEQASLVTTRYQLTVYGKNYSNTKATVEEIRQAFSGFKGQMGGASGTYVSSCFLDNEIDRFDQTLSSTDYYQVVVDYLIRHYE